MAHSADISSLVGKIHEGPCLDLLPLVPTGSVDMILADLPYGTTKNRWDSVIDLDELWEQYERVIKQNGAIVLTAAQPFTSVLTCSNLKMFKYEWVWSKTIGSGQLNAKKQPLRTHETVLVFYKKPPTYNAQMSEGTPYTAKRAGSQWDGRGYNSQVDHEVENTGTRVPKSVLLIPNPRIKGGHPTQKPVALFEYLIRTYTNEGEVVLDNVIGSGTTAIAALNAGRQFIGMERDPDYAASASERVAKWHSEHGKEGATAAVADVGSKESA